MQKEVKVEFVNWLNEFHWIMHILMKVRGSKIKEVTRIRQDFDLCGHLWCHKNCVSQQIHLFLNFKCPLNENHLNLKLQDKTRIKEYFVSYKVIFLCTLLAGISVTNWKELNPAVNRICAEYCGGLMERSKKENWKFILFSYWIV